MRVYLYFIFFCIVQVYGMRVGVHMGLTSYNVTLQYLSTVEAFTELELDENGNLTIIIPSDIPSPMTIKTTFCYN